MAKFRKVFTAFWDDLFIEKLSPEDRYFYLFLLTNPLCTECGIYEISPSKICSYTGYNRETVMTILKRFQDSEKLVYNDDTFELAIINKMRYLDRLGKPVLDCLSAELKKIKDIELIKIVGNQSDNEQVKSLFNEVYTSRKIKKHDTSAEKNTIRPILGDKKRIEEEKEEEENRSNPAPENKVTNSNLNRQPNIPTKDKVWEVFRAGGGTKEMAKSFYEKHDGTGWFINGSPIINFTSLANKFIDNWNRNEESKNPKTENVKIKLK
jgi:hypothetical protein